MQINAIQEAGHQAELRAGGEQMLVPLKWHCPVRQWQVMYYTVWTAPDGWVTGEWVNLRVGVERSSVVRWHRYICSCGSGKAGSPVHIAQLLHCSLKIQPNLL